MCLGTSKSKISQHISGVSVLNFWIPHVGTPTIPLGPIYSPIDQMFKVNTIDIELLYCYSVGQVVLRL
jgi:hypothetical protein